MPQLIAIGAAGGLLVGGATFQEFAFSGAQPSARLAFPGVTLPAATVTPAAPGQGLRVTVVAATVAVWQRSQNGQATRLQRGKTVLVPAGDDLILSSSSDESPHEEPEYAYLCADGEGDAGMEPVRGAPSWPWPSCAVAPAELAAPPCLPQRQKSDTSRAPILHHCRSLHWKTAGPSRWHWKAPRRHLNS
jgi:hypothetical protein